MYHTVALTLNHFPQRPNIRKRRGPLSRPCYQLSGLRP